MRQLAELLHKRLDITVQLFQQCNRGVEIGLGELPGEAHVRAESHELLLSAVMEIPLDPSPPGVGGRDDTSARDPQLLGLVLDLGERGLEL